MAATPAPATAPPTIPGVAKLDPDVEKLLKSIDRVLPPEPVAEPEGTGTGETLGEIVARENEKAKLAAPVVPPVVPAVVPPVVAAPVVVPPVVPKVVKAPAPVIAAPATTPAPPVATPTVVVPDAAAEAKKTADAEFIKTLTPEQVEELEFARFADKNGQTGKEAAILDYYREVDKFIEANPKVDPDESDEFKALVAERQPKWGAADRRRLEKQMIIDAATATVRTETSTKQERLERELKEMKLTPIIKQIVDSIGDSITTPNEINKDALAIDPDVVKMIREKGYDAAAKEYPSEAAIAQGAMQAADQWTRIQAGLTNLDMAGNPTHQWLIRFIGNEGANLRRAPAAAQMRDGKQFLPLHEYMQALRDNPANAQKFWSFTDNDVLNMIAFSAQIANKVEVDRAEATVNRRKAKTVSAVPPNTAPATTTVPPVTAAPPVTPIVATEPPDEGSPSTVTSAMTGVVIDDKATPSEAEDFISQLVPGYKK